MSRTVFGNIMNADGTVPAEPVVWDLQELIATDDGIVLPGSYEADLNNSTGEFTITLPTPASGSALYHYTYPNGLAYATQLETGPSVDIRTIQTIEEADVAQDALQDLMDQAEQFTSTTVSSGPYTVLATDEYIYIPSGTFAVNMIPCLDASSAWLIVDNDGSGTITVTANGTDTINGAATLILYPGDRRTFVPVADGVWRA
jgi:hypothetical protein